MVTSWQETDSEDVDSALARTLRNIDRQIEQGSHEQANHQAELRAIQNDYPYQENSNYDPGAFREESDV